MANELFIGVPNDVDEPETLRLFLVQLIVKLSTVLGQDPGVTLQTVNQAISALQEQFDSSIGTFQSQLTTGIVISEVDTMLPTISASYEQTEVQEVTDKLAEALTTLNSVVSALKQAGIIQ